MNRYHCSLVESDSVGLEHKKEMKKIVIDVLFQEDDDTGIYLSYENAEKFLEEMKNMLSGVEKNE